MPALAGLRTRPGALAALLLVAVATASCSTWRGPAPDTLLAEGREALRTRDYETCYVRARQIREEHPDAPVRHEAFALAAACHNRLHTIYRVLDRGEPDAARWRTREKEFMFDWLLSQYFDGAESFPEEGVNLFFEGYVFQVFMDFGAYAGHRPEVTRWDLRAHTDNGRILRVASGGVGRRLDGTATWDDD